MHEQPPDGVIVFRARRRARCLELWAVLDAAGIEAAIADRPGGCLLVVRERDAQRAALELEDYRNEGPLRKPEPPLTVLGGGWAGILAYASVLVAVAGFVSRRLLDADWLAVGRAQAGLIVGGEWWRTVTALTLHVDARHLMGNLVFGSVLGLLAAQGLGGGVAWLAIVVGGALGNAANALLQDPSHRAVGASTAVFAALGLLVALALHRRRAGAVSGLRRWSPLVAGLLLLAWTGIGGERTDVMAHVTGLIAGVAVGLGAGFLPQALLERRTVQLVAAVAAVLIVVVAWAAALAQGTAPS